MLDTLRSIGLQLATPTHRTSEIIRYFIERRSDISASKRIGFFTKEKTVKVDSVDKDDCFELFSYIFERTHAKKPKPRLSRVSEAHKITCSVILRDVEGILDQLKEDRKGKYIKLIKMLENLRDVLVNNSEELDIEIKRQLSNEKGKLFYTVGIDNQWVAEIDEYKEYLWDSIRKYYEEGVEGTCYVCGQAGKVVGDPDFLSGTPLKIFVKKWKGFLAGIPAEDNPFTFTNTFTLCPDCLGYVLAGYKYIESNFRYYLLSHRMDAFVFPRAKIEITKGSKEIKKVKNVWDFLFGEMEYLEEETSDGSNFVDLPVTFTIVFGSRGQADYNLYGVIYDKPNYKVRECAENLSRMGRMLDQIYKVKSKRFKFSFDSMTDLLPLMKTKDNEIIPTEKKLLVDLIASIIGEALIDTNLFIQRAVLLSKLIYYRNRLNYHVNIGLSKNTESDFKKVADSISNRIIRWNALLTLINNTNGMMKMIENEQDYNPQKYEEFVLNNLDQVWKKGLIHLGFSIERLSFIQMRERGDFKNPPPIFSSIDFTGMNDARVRSFLIQAWETVKNYRVHKSDPAVENLSKAQALLADNKMGNPIENVYYILLGYSLAHQSRIAKSEKGYAAEENEE